MATLLDGRQLAATLRHELSQKISQLGFTPRLGVILVGNDPASHLYVKLKEQAAAEVGIAVDKVLLPQEATFNSVTAAVQAFNTNPGIHAVLIQLPLPPQLNEYEVIASLVAAKDADGFHPDNLARFLAGQPAVTPGVSQGIMHLLNLAHQPLPGKFAALVVNSQEFAQPLQKLLKDRGVKTAILYQPDIAKLQQADIVVVAIGRPDSITSAHIKDGTIVIDVGTTRVGTQVKGDVNAASLAGRPVYLTPVPGGVGPITVAMLLWNVYQLACNSG